MRCSLIAVLALISEAVEGAALAGSFTRRIVSLGCAGWHDRLELRGR
jgi:hypothetical protein